MRYLFFLIVIFCNCPAKAQSGHVEIHLCGKIYKTDSVSWYTSSNVGIYPVPKGYCCITKSFTGVLHNERFEDNYEDPGFPGHEFVYLNDTLTTRYYAWDVVDSFKVSDFRADSSLYVIIGENKFPVCEIHVKSDSSQTEKAFRFDMSGNDRKWDIAGTWLLSADLVKELKESHSDKYFITEIYYYDWDQKKKVKFDFSFYITK